MSSTSDRLRGAAWLTLAPIALNAVSLAANGYLIPALGPLEYGVWTTSMALVGATSMVTNLGLRPLYTRSVAGAAAHEQQQLLAEQLGLRLFLATCAAVVSVLGAVALGYGGRIILLVAISSLGVLLTVAWTVLADVLTARELFRRTATAAFWSGLVLTAASVLAAMVGLGAIGVAAAYLLGPLINLAMLATTLRGLGLRVRISIDPLRYRILLRNSRQIALGDLVETVRDRADGVYIPKLLGTTSFGFLSAGLMPATRLITIPDGLATSHFPQIAANHAAGNREASMALVRELIILTLLLTPPLAVLLVSFAPFLAATFYPGIARSNARAVVQTVMIISAFAVPLTGLTQALRQSLHAAKQHIAASKASRNSTIVSAGAGLVLVVLFGIPGAAWAYVLRQGASTAWLLAPFRREYRGTVTSIPWARVLLPGIAMSVASLLLGVFQTIELAKVLLNGTVLAGVGAVAILLTGLVSWRDLPGSAWVRTTISMKKS